MSKNAYALLEIEGDHDDAAHVEPVRDVQVDALVVLKIIKHAKEHYPSAVTGALLGMDVDETLQVTQCYPNLSKQRRGDDHHHEDDAATAELDENYQLEMMKCLRQVNADANTVGWYHSAPFAHFLYHSWVSIMADFQANIPQSIVLEYDPLGSQTGRLALRAFRLTQSFFSLFKGKPRSAMNTENVTASNLLEEGLLEELPITVRNFHLVSAMMYSAGLSMSALAAPMPAVPRDAYMAKHVSHMLETLDDLTQEQTRYAGWKRVYAREKARIESLVHRKRHDSPAEAEAMYRQLAAKLPHEPPKLDSLLLSHQVALHAQEVDAFVGPAVLSVELARMNMEESSAAAAEHN